MLRYLCLTCIVCLTSFSSWAQTPNPNPELRVEITEEQSCTLQYNITRQIIDRIGYCETDSDCVSYDFGCPFPCKSPINRNEAVDFTKETVKAYQEKCAKDCERTCETPQEDIKPTCIYGHCRYENPSEDISID